MCGFLCRGMVAFQTTHPSFGIQNVCQIVVLVALVLNVLPFIDVLCHSEYFSTFSHTELHSMATNTPTQTQAFVATLIQTSDETVTNVTAIIFKYNLTRGSNLGILRTGHNFRITCQR